MRYLYVKLEKLLRKERIRVNRENIYSLKGFSKVYGFTIKQTFKNKAYLASIFVFMFVFILMGPLNYFMTKSGMGMEENMSNKDLEEIELGNIFIKNETGVSFDNPTLGEAKVLTYDGLATKDELSQKLGENDALVVISKSETEYKVDGIISDSSALKVQDITAITESVKDTFDEARLSELSIDEKDIQKISKGIDHDSAITEEEYIEEENKTVSGDSYMKYILAFSIIIFMMVTMSNSYIISSVTEEKQSKLVETLLVSVRPMALLMGKILGMMTYILTILAIGIFSSKISDFIMKNVIKVDMKYYNGAGFDLSIFTGMDAISTIFVIATVIIGFLSFAILAGLFGSACTKMEDIQNATGNIMTIAMLGYFVSFGAGMMDKGIVNHLLALIPPFSYFTVPVMYVSGRIELPVVLISYVIQLIILVLLVLLSAKTYRNLLLSDSSTPKLKAIFKSAKA